MERSTEIDDVAPTERCPGCERGDEVHVPVPHGIVDNPIGVLEDSLALTKRQIVSAATYQSVGTVLGGDSLFQQRILVVQAAAFFHELRLLEIDQHQEAVGEALFDARVECVEIGGAVGKRLSLDAAGAGKLWKGGKKLAARNHAAIQSGAGQQARKRIGHVR